MSSTTRVGFVVPAPTDFADEIIYFDNNITLLEAELPSQVVASLPVSGNYTGRVCTIALADSGPDQAAMPFATYVWSGTAWVFIGGFGYKDAFKQSFTSTSVSKVPQTAGPEVFSGSVLLSSNTIQVNPNQILRFTFQETLLTLSEGTGQFIGYANIFINPSSATPPTPTTPGAVRIKIPINLEDCDANAISHVRQTYVFGEALYDPNVSASATYGISMYFSATTNINTNGMFPNGVIDSQGNSVMLMVEAMGTQ